MTALAPLAGGAAWKRLGVCALAMLSVLSLAPMAEARVAQLRPIPNSLDVQTDGERYAVVGTASPSRYKVLDTATGSTREVNLGPTCGVARVGELDENDSVNAGRALISCLPPGERVGSYYLFDLRTLGQTPLNNEFQSGETRERRPFYYLGAQWAGGDYHYLNLQTGEQRVVIPPPGARPQPSLDDPQLRVLRPCQPGGKRYRLLVRTKGLFLKRCGGRLRTLDREYTGKGNLALNTHHVTWFTRRGARRLTVRALRSGRQRVFEVPRSPAAGPPYYCEAGDLAFAFTTQNAVFVAVTSETADDCFAYKFRVYRGAL